MAWFLLLLCLSLAVLFLWAGRILVRDFWSRRFRVSPDTSWLPNYWYVPLIGGSCIMLVLAGLIGYALFRELRAPAEIAMYVPVYPEASSSGWAPPVSKERYWLFETADNLAAIEKFYGKVASDGGWKIVRSGSAARLYMKLEKENLIVTLMASRIGSRSKLSYRVTEKAAVSQQK